MLRLASLLCQDLFHAVSTRLGLLVSGMKREATFMGIQMSP